MQVVGVVFNLSPEIEYFQSDIQLKVGDHCLVRSQRGLEYAKVKLISDKESADGRVVRIATLQDKQINEENLCLGDEIKFKIKQIIKQYNNDIRVSKCEYTFDKEKLIIHYTSSDRVDFRDLVKILASELKLRIEMHQISSREETQLVGAIGCCGRVCCCKNHLCEFDKVSIKMAKKQGLSLNPQKLNGMCGKLLCCLRYENDFYEEMSNKMPHINEKVTTPDGEGVVKSTDCLKEMVEIVFTNGDETSNKTYPLKDIKFKRDEKNG